jgi:hypothetical protein
MLSKAFEMKFDILLNKVKLSHTDSVNLVIIGEVFDLVKF